LERKHVWKTSFAIVIESLLRAAEGTPWFLGEQLNTHAGLPGESKYEQKKAAAYAVALTRESLPEPTATVSR
jgi:hypothetical protein